MFQGPGWYRDPAGSQGLRWWDGHAWTQVTTHDPAREMAARVGGAQTVSQTRVVPPITTMEVPPPPAQQATHARHHVDVGSLSRGAPRFRSRLFLGAVAGWVAVAAAVSVIISFSGTRHPKPDAAGTSIQMPETVAGLSRSHDQRTLDLTASLSSLPFHGPHEAGLYETSAGDTVVMTFVVKSAVAPTGVETRLKQVEATFLIDAPTGTTFHQASAGPLGGLMDCLDAAHGKTKLHVCEFADTAAFGQVVLYGSASVDTGLPLVVRSAIETRH